MTGNVQIRTASDFGYRLRQAREKRAITQADLAVRAGVSTRWLSNFERGKSPRAELIKVLHVARALGLAFELAEERQRPIQPSQQAIVDAFRASAHGGAGSRLAMTHALERLNSQTERVLSTESDRLAQLAPELNKVIDALEANNLELSPAVLESLAKLNASLADLSETAPVAEHGDRDGEA